MNFTMIIVCLILTSAIFTIIYPFLQSYFRFVDKSHKEVEEMDISDRW
jgi:hypothetical protein